MIEKFRYLVGVLEKEEKKTLKKWIVFNVVSGFINILSFGITIYYINAIPGIYNVTGMLQKSVEMFVVFVALTEVLYIAGSFWGLYQLKLSNQIILYGAQKLSIKIYELFVKEDLEYHNQKNVMQAFEMVRNDTNNCIEIITVCIGIWQNLAVLLIYITMLTFAYRWLGMLGGILLVSIIIGLFYWSRMRMKVYGERSRMYAVKTNAQITTAYGAFEETKLSNKSEFVIQKYSNASAAYAEAQSEFKLKEGIISLVMAFSVRGMRYVIFAFLVILSDKLIPFLVPIAAYIIALDKMMPVANSIVNGIGKLEFSKKPYEELKKNLARYKALKEREDVSVQERKKRITLQKGLVIRNISFAYNENTPIFEDASMEIPVGHSVAVIGVSGVGKTTLLSLVLGFFKPQSGSILYDDYNIVTETDEQGHCEATLGDIVSYIPQTVYMNGETVRHNVAFFEEEDKIDDERVVECLKCVQVWKEVERMPDGIHTLIRERGTTISGGQRQRIALARALYRDFELLVMDEATAALDMDMEKAVIDSIKQIKKNKTILLVTHHMSLADECDMIYKIENRKIVRVK